MNCPHRHIVECPLYIASHNPELAGKGCVTDMAKPCRVRQGESFDKLYRALLGNAPDMPKKKP